MPDETPDFQRGWDAALLAVSHWHQDKAKRAMILSRRSRFPKTLEREAEVHTQSAEGVMSITPEDL